MSLLRIIWETCINWCHSTSIAGLAKAVQSKSHFKKAYWACLFCIGAFATLYNLFVTLNEYFAYDVSTSTDLDFQRSVAFPAVSICNLNRLVLYDFTIFQYYIIYYTRVHCIHLMEEQHKVFIEINELTNSTNDDATQQLLSTKTKTWENLDKLINSSGCLEQICDLLEDELPNDGILIDNDETIGLLKLKRKIG